MNPRISSDFTFTGLAHRALALVVDFQYSRAVGQSQPGNAVKTPDCEEATQRRYEFVIRVRGATSRYNNMKEIFP